MALEPLTIGEKLLFIPYHNCLWPRENQDPLSGLVEAIADASENSGSAWHDYINHIREIGSLNHLPVFSELTGYSSVANVYRSLVLPLKEQYSSWAVGLALSRCFSSENREEGIAFVPFADQFNHSTNSWNTRIREDSKGFMFFAEKNIEKGEEIFNNYGIESDIEMWVTHGFVDDGLNTSLIYIPLSLLKRDDSSLPSDDDPLLKIDVNSSDPIPEELRSLLVLDDFIARLVDALILALDRMLDSDFASSGSHDPILVSLLEKDRKNCEFYKQRLLALK